MVSRTKSYKTGPSLPNNGHAGMLEPRGVGEVYSREFWIGVCREGSSTLTLFKD